MNAVVVLLGVAWGLAGALPLFRRARRDRVRRRATDLGRARPARIPSFRGRALPGGRIALVATAPLRRKRRREQMHALDRGLPLALDVVTMAARAGHTPRLALAAASPWCPPVVGTAFDAVEARCRLGESFADALDDLGRHEPALRSLTDALAVADRSGAPVADLLARLADDARQSLRRRAEAHARRMPVRLLFPLVFLVLPAFGLLTVVPAVVTGLRNP
jgi:Flp pilus assembly protein TadB